MANEAERIPWTPSALRPGNSAGGQGHAKTSEPQESYSSIAATNVAATFTTTNNNDPGPAGTPRTDAAKPALARRACTSKPAVVTGMGTSNAEEPRSAPTTAPCSAGSVPENGWREDAGKQDG